MNDARATAMMKDIAGDLGGDAGWHAMPAPMMGAEDFSYVLRKVPGAMSFIGVAAAGSNHLTNPPLHNTRMKIEEDVMARGIALHCAGGDRFLDRGLDYSDRKRVEEGKSGTGRVGSGGRGHNQKK